MHQATETRTLAAAPGRGGGRARLVATLAVTQTIGYGVLYYAFAVVLHPIATDLRVGPANVTGALTVTVLISAVAAIPVGRWLPARWPRADDSRLRARRPGHARLVPGPRHGAALPAFVAIGVASAMVLYEAAFAVLVAVLDPR